MKVIVGCESSQAVCLAFRERGHEAYSCDLLSCDGPNPEWHIQEDIFMRLWNCRIPHIAIENPIGCMSSVFRKPDQVIQPWMFGHGETKATCLWLKNLRPLVPTKIVSGREQRIFNMPPGEDRWKERSKTFPGIAEAMAAQWSRPQGVQLHFFNPEYCIA